MESLIIHGCKLCILCATDARGRRPADDFLAELTVDPKRKRDHANLMHLFQALADHGKITNEEQFKAVAGTNPKLYEFKKHQVRVFGFFSVGKFILTNGYIKKTNKLDKSEIERAHRIRAEHLQTEERPNDQHTGPLPRKS